MKVSGARKLFRNTDTCQTSQESFHVYFTLNQETSAPSNMLTEVKLVRSCGIHQLLPPPSGSGGDEASLLAAQRHVGMFQC